MGLMSSEGRQREINQQVNQQNYLSYDDVRHEENTTGGCGRHGPAVWVRVQPGVLGRPL